MKVKVAQLVKNPPAMQETPVQFLGQRNVGDLGLILELGRSPGEEKGYPLLYSGLENPMDVHGVATE